MACGLADDGFGLEGDAEASELEHGKIVGPIAYRDHLFEREVFLGGDLLEESGFSAAVDDFGVDFAGDDAVLDVEFVGVDVIDAEALLEVLAEESEAAGEDGGFVAEAFKGGDETLGTVGEGNGPDQSIKGRGGETFQESDAAAETGGEIEFAAHGGLGDGLDLGSDAGEFGEFIDDFGLD